MGSRKRLKQIWVPYTEWEDWVNGMWAKGKDEDLQRAIDFTGNHIEYGKAMAEVVISWPRTMLNSMTNPGINRRAFLGHCAVCYRLGISESITRQAWAFLTEQQRVDADNEAEKNIKIYEESHKRIYNDMGE